MSDGVEGISDATLQKLADKLKARMGSSIEPGAIDPRGRGLVGDAWVMDFHKTCPRVDLVANGGRLYAYCEPHRCLGVVGYEFGTRITFDDAMVMEHEPVPNEVLAERKKRADAMAKGGA